MILGIIIKVCTYVHIEIDRKTYIDVCVCIYMNTLMS